MNIIQQYEWRYICYEELLEGIWGYGQQLINEVGVECFTFYVEASAGYHSFYYYIAPYEESERSTGSKKAFRGR